MKTLIKIILNITFGVLSLACGKDQLEQENGPPFDPYCAAVEIPALDTTPTYVDDVAEILSAHCIKCHSEGGIGPSKFDDYESAKAMAPVIAAMVKSGQMPPFPAAQCQECPTIASAPQITPEERATLIAWADTDATRGEGDVNPAPSTLASLSDAPQDRVDIITAEVYTPQTSPEFPTDDYRCFVIEPAEALQGGYMTGWNFTHGDSILTGTDNDGDGVDDGVNGRDKVVHHALLFLVDNQAAVDEAKMKSTNDTSGAGYECFGGPNVSSKMIGGWVPGIGAVLLPNNTGIEIPANSRFILQLHYYVAGQSYADETRVELAMKNTVGQPGVMLGLSQRELELPPKQESVLRRASKEVPRSAKVWGFAAHMHKLGASFQMVNRRNDEEDCILEIPRWDFNWQYFYFLEEGVSLSPGDRVEARYYFDTRSVDQVTNWGESTDDEMAITYVFVTGL